jgi:hypothetical protein
MLNVAYHLPIARALAEDLAETEVDPNEAQKTLAYLKSRGESRALFDYLKTVVQNGGAVIRSGRTLGYYRNLEKACKQHLKPLQDDYEAMLWTFGWSLRLLRYNNTVGGHVRHEIFSPPSRPAPRPSSRQPVPTPSAPDIAPAEPAPSPAEPAPFTPVETRTLGIIVEVATQQQTGKLEDADGRSYGYRVDDVIGTQPGEQAKILFRAEKRKVEVKRGRRKELKNMPWAEDVELT